MMQAPNGEDGIIVTGSAANCTIGGDRSGDGDFAVSVIGWSGIDGISAEGPGLLLHNTYIGLAKDGKTKAPNSESPPFSLFRPHDVPRPRSTPAFG